MTQYTFECECPRCKNDLNVYQACAASPSADLNKTWFDDWDTKLRKHHGITNEVAVKTSQNAPLEALETIELASHVENLEVKEKAIKDQYEACRELIDQNLWAVSPLANLLTEISILYSEKQNFAYALFVACFSACESDPFRFPAVFHPSRSRALLVIARLLSNTAPLAAKQQSEEKSTSPESTLYESAIEKLVKIDQVSLCQMLLVIILRGASDKRLMEWEVAKAAAEMLYEIENLPGREQENSLIRLWQESPGDDESKALFHYAVVKQLDTLAQLGKQVLESDFDPKNQK